MLVHCGYIASSGTHCGRKAISDTSCKIKSRPIQIIRLALSLIQIGSRLIRIRHDYCPGMIPAEIFGSEPYGAVNGALSAPVLAPRAAGPIVASLIWSATGGYDAVLIALAAIGIVSV